MSQTLDHYSRRGYIYYIAPDGTHRKEAGWFHREGNYVLMRNIRGRNTFNLCQLDNVVLWESNSEAKN